MPRNSKGQFVKGGGRRGGGRRFGGGRGRSRGRSKPVHSASNIVGGAASVYGLLLQPPQPGWANSLDTLIGHNVTANPGDALYNMKESIPFYGTDSNMAGNRSTVGAGIAVILGGKVIGYLFPGLRRSMKVGKLRVRAVG